jgi:hypothetical protein
MLKLISSIARRASAKLSSKLSLTPRPRIDQDRKQFHEVLSHEPRAGRRWKRLRFLDLSLARTLSALVPTDSRDECPSCVNSSSTLWSESRSAP